MTTRATRRSPERTQFLVDVLTTACEGGITYWSFLADYNIWEDPKAAEPVLKMDPKLRLFDFVGAEDVLPHHASWADVFWKQLANEQGWTALPAEHRYELDVEVIARGLRKLQDYCCGKDDHKRAPNHYYGWQMVRANRTNGRSGDYDSELADMVVQFGLFGTVQYG